MYTHPVSFGGWQWDSTPRQSPRLQRGPQGIGQQQDTAPTPYTDHSPAAHTTASLPPFYPAASTVLNPVHPGLWSQDLILSTAQAETYPPAPCRLPGGGPALGMPSSEKGGYLPKALMSFRILVSDPKSTRNLFQGWEEGDAAMTETGHKQGSGVVRGTPQRLTA